MLTLTEESFARACRQLAGKIAASGFRPDIIVGIATGGDYVAARILDSFPDSQRASVRSRRPSTGAKERLGGVIRRLPRPVADLLRRLEHRLLAGLDRLRKPEPPAVKLDPGLNDLLKENPEARILVVDDAVDSGVTLLGVTRAIAEAAPGAELRTAVITRTRPHPRLSPDFHLHTALTRFPWSLDSKP